MRSGEASGVRDLRRHGGHMARRLAAIVVAAGVAPAAAVGCGAAPEPEPAAEGQITDAVVAAAVGRRADALEQCAAEEALAETSRPVLVAIDVGRDGRVRRVSTVGADAVPLRPATASCIRERLDTMRFARTYEPLTTHVEILPAPAAAPHARSRERIEDVIRNRRDAIRACYEQALNTDRDLAGRLTVSWMIESDGGVQSVAVVEDSVGDDSVRSCVLREVQSMDFGSTDIEPIGIIYPFVFNPAQR